MSNLVLNPLTNRFIRVNGPKYNRLVKEAVITPTVETPITVEPPTPPPTPEPVVPISVKTEVAKVAVNLVKTNKSQFLDLNQEETNKLLRKLLIERLAPKKAEKKKKSKFKVVEPSSSSTDSDSD